MSHYGLAEFAAATPYLKQAIDRDAQNLPLLLTLAHSCLLSQQYPCVLDAFHRIMSLNPNSAEAHMLAGEALDEMKEPVDAIRELRAAVQANPREPNVHFALGYLLWTQGRTGEAARECPGRDSNSDIFRYRLLRSKRNCPLDTYGRRYRGTITLRTRCAHRPKPPNSAQKPTASVEQSAELSKCCLGQSKRLNPRLRGRTDPHLSVR